MEAATVANVSAVSSEIQMTDAAAGSELYINSNNNIEETVASSSNNQEKNLVCNRTRFHRLVLLIGPKCNYLIQSLRRLKSNSLKLASEKTAIYHERQKLQFCLLHSLNNLFQAHPEGSYHLGFYIVT